MNSQERQIQHALHACAEQAIPDSVDLWLRIRAQAAAARQPARKATIFPLRLQPVALLLLVILLTGVGCAAGAAIQKVFFENTLGMSDVVEGGLIHTVNQSQTIDGVTVTIHSAYVDARRLALGISVRGDMGDHYSIWGGTPKLNGVELLGLQYSGGAGSVWDLVGNESDAEPVPGFIYGVDLTDDVSPAIAELTRIRPGGDPAMVNIQLDLKVHDSYRDERFDPIGPFHFSFDTPLQPAHRLELHQTSRDAGVAVTLEDVLITPSLMQTRICFDPEESDDRWNAEITAVRPDGLRIQSQAGMELNAGCLLSTFYGVQLDPSGAWTLSIDQLKSETETIDGSWTFKFEVPKPTP